MLVGTPPSRTSIHWRGTCSESPPDCKPDTSGSIAPSGRRHHPRCEPPLSRRRRRRSNYITSSALPLLEAARFGTPHLRVPAGPGVQTWRSWFPAAGAATRWRRRHSRPVVQPTWLSGGPVARGAADADDGRDARTRPCGRRDQLSRGGRRVTTVAATGGSHLSDMGYRPAAARVRRRSGLSPARATLNVASVGWPLPWRWPARPGR